MAAQALVSVEHTAVHVPRIAEHAVLRDDSICHELFKCPQSWQWRIVIERIIILAPAHCDQHTSKALNSIKPVLRMNVIRSVHCHDVLNSICFICLPHLLEHIKNIFVADSFKYSDIPIIQSFTDRRINPHEDMHFSVDHRQISHLISRRSRKVEFLDAELSDRSRQKTLHSLHTAILILSDTVNLVWFKKTVPLIIIQAERIRDFLNDLRFCRQSCSVLILEKSSPWYIHTLNNIIDCNFPDSHNAGKFVRKISHSSLISYVSDIFLTLSPEGIIMLIIQKIIKYYKESILSFPVFYRLMTVH